MSRVLIVDDEKRAINILKILLEKHIDGIDDVHTALGPEEGLLKFEHTNPDLLFLDVEMPGMTGFELLERIREFNKNVNVIFTTAYDHYAIRAIRFSAIDYLLKPIDLQELKEAYQRYLDSVRQPDGKGEELLSNLLSNIRSIHTQKPRLAIPTQGGAVFYDVDEIVRCESKDNYTVFHIADGQTFMSSKTLKDYDALLNDYNFLRVHQSHLIHPAFIKQYTQKGLLELKDGSNVPVSRRKHHWLQDRLKIMYRGG